MLTCLAPKPRSQASHPGRAATPQLRGLGGRTALIRFALSLAGARHGAPIGRAVMLASIVCCAIGLRAAAGAHNSPVGGGEPSEGRGWQLPNRPSLFSIVRFPNDECFDSSNQSGTCYTGLECRLIGGQPSSPCAAGFGACCIVSRSCHVSTRERVVYFKNPSFPAPDSEERFCDLTVELRDPNVCQLRLDLMDFQLDPPTAGACRHDYMEVSASGLAPQSIPRLCGLNRNQHLYVTVPQDSGAERSASIVFYTDPVGDHRWQVKVTQIDCSQLRPSEAAQAGGLRAPPALKVSPLWQSAAAAAGGAGGLAGAKYSTTFASGLAALSQTASALAIELLRPQFTPRAPLGCLQYHTAASGLIESFNFGQQQYLNGLDYAICIQRHAHTCRVVYVAGDYDFSVGSSTTPGAGSTTSGVGDQDCAQDYLSVPASSRTGDGFTYDRYCGARLHYFRGQSIGAPLVSKAQGPIVLRFHSDAHFEPTNSAGFRVQYEQSGQDCLYHTAEEAGSLASSHLLASSLADARPLDGTLDAPVVLYASQQQSPQQLELAARPEAIKRLDEQAQDREPQSQPEAAAYNQLDAQSPFADTLVGQAAGHAHARLLADLNKAFQLVTGKSAPRRRARLGRHQRLV